MYQYVPMTKYDDFLRDCVRDALLHQEEVQALRLEIFKQYMTSAAHISDGKADMALIYCPSQFEPKLYKKALRDLKASAAIFVELLRGGVSILRIAACQAYIKQVPLVIKDLTIFSQVQQFLGSGEPGDKLEADHSWPLGSDRYYVFSQDELSKLVEIELENSYCGPVFDKAGQKYEVLQVNLPNEFNAIAGLMSIGFLDDPSIRVIDPDTKLRETLLFTLAASIARDTAKRGMNYLLVKDYNIFDAGAGLLASPPGYTGGYWGPELQVAKMMVKAGISLLQVGALGFLDRFHGRNCGSLRNHVYIGWLSCALGCRGSGLGTQLFRLSNNIADQCQAYEYLENSKEKNLEFYHKEGLQVIQNIRVLRPPGENATVYGMLRDAGGPRTPGLEHRDYNPEVDEVVLKYSYGV